jgi:hypothetical protein
MNGERTETICARTKRATHRVEGVRGRAWANTERGIVIPARAEEAAQRRKHISERRTEISALRKHAFVSVMVVVLEDAVVG